MGRGISLEKTIIPCDAAFDPNGLKLLSLDRVAILDDCAFDQGREQVQLMREWDATGRGFGMDGGDLRLCVFAEQRRDPSLGIGIQADKSIGDGRILGEQVLNDGIRRGIHSTSLSLKNIWDHNPHFQIGVTHAGQIPRARSH